MAGFILPIRFPPWSKDAGFPTRIFYESELYHWRPLNIWEVHHCSIPTVLRRGVQFVLTAKIVNMFKGEGKVNAQRRAETAQKRRQA